MRILYFIQSLGVASSKRGAGREVLENDAKGEDNVPISYDEDAAQEKDVKELDPMEDERELDVQPWIRALDIGQVFSFLEH